MVLARRQIDPPRSRRAGGIAGLMGVVAASAVFLGSLRTPFGPVASLLACSIVAGVVAPIRAFRRVRRLDARWLARRDDGFRTDRHILALAIAAVLTWAAWFGVGYLVAVVGTFASFHLTARSAP